MPSRFQVGDSVACQRDSNALGKTFPGKITQVDKGVRAAGSNFHSDFSVCLYCLFDVLTCGRCQPENLWHYAVRYESDGYEEKRVPAGRLVKTDPV
jgi:hypothetical protein